MVGSICPFVCRPVAMVVRALSFEPFENQMTIASPRDLSVCSLDHR